jgi:S-formylglutathione hydrolase FrmB
MRPLWLALGVAALIAGALAVRHALTRDRHGASVTHFTLHSRLLHRDLEETAIVAKETPERNAPLLLLLPGRGKKLQDGLQTEALFAGLAKLGRRAPNVVLVNGADHSYFHDRRDGPWGSYVLREVLPQAIKRFHADPQRVAIGGISMGGWGALDLARLARNRFCAVGGHSAAMWRSGGETPAGAFDDAEDFARHDLIGAARSDPGLFGNTRVWLDAGDADPFHGALSEFASVVRSGGAPVRLRTWKGEHEGAYWDAHWAAYLRFYADALEHCAPSG